MRQRGVGEMLTELRPPFDSSSSSPAHNRVHHHRIMDDTEEGRYGGLKTPDLAASKNLLGLLSHSYGIDGAMVLLRQLQQQHQVNPSHPHTAWPKLPDLVSRHHRPPITTSWPDSPDSAPDAPPPPPPTKSTTTTAAPPQRQRRRNTPAYLACHVCGDRAPNHVHYGGIACFSCRAFFRRSVPKFHTYFCTAERRCEITPATRKNCQFCRYQTCLSSGMKASWVLSDEEKVERMEKKRRNRKQRQIDKTTELAKKGTESFSGSSSRSPSPSSALPSSLSPRSEMDYEDFSFADEKLLDEWLYAQDSTRHTVPMPAEVMSEILALTRNGGIMRESGIVGLFKVVYSRVVKFVGFVDKFQDLPDTDKKLLLSKNLDMLSNIRLVACFNPDGTGNLAEQMCLVGRCDNLDFCLGDSAIDVRQVFVEPWAKSKDHASMFEEVMRKLILSCKDVKIGLLFQLVALFHSDNIPVRQRDEIERFQESMAVLLQRYLRRRFPFAEANVIFSNLILMLHDLRRLADILTDGD